MDFGTVVACGLEVEWVLFDLVSAAKAKPGEINIIAAIAKATADAVATGNRLVC